MTDVAMPILADADDVPVKIIIGIVVMLFWAIGSLAKLSKKKSPAQLRLEQEERDRQAREHWEEVRRREAMMAQAMAQQQQQVQQQRPGYPAAPPPLPAMPAVLQQQQQQQQQRPRGPMVPPMRTIPMPPPNRPAPQAVRQSQRPSKKKQRRPQQQQQQRPPMFPPALVEPDSGPTRLTAAADTPGVTESEIGAGSAPASPSRRLAEAGSPMAAVVSGLTAQALRQQFILTELLQPPLALREPEKRSTP